MDYLWVCLKRYAEIFILHYHQNTMFMALNMIFSSIWYWLFQLFTSVTLHSTEFLFTSVTLHTTEFLFELKCNREKFFRPLLISRKGSYEINSVISWSVGQTIVMISLKRIVRFFRNCTWSYGLRCHKGKNLTAGFFWKGENPENTHKIMLLLFLVKNLTHWCFFNFKWNFNFQLFQLTIL